jgi:hypothetical protein
MSLARGPVAQAAVSKPGGNGDVAREVGEGYQAGGFKLAQHAAWLDEPLGAARLEPLAAAQAAARIDVQDGQVVDTRRARYVVQGEDDTMFAAQGPCLVNVGGLLRCEAGCAGAIA